jgi:hypothetical protein
MATYLTSNIFSDVNITGNCIVQGSLTTGNAGMFRNKLYNGNFQIWQRNTTFSGIGTNTYTADRWVTPTNAGAGSTLTVSRSTNVPSGAGFNYSMQIVTAATTGAPSLIEQRIEAVNVSDLVNGSYVTVSFWAIQTSPATFVTLNTQLLYPTTADTFSSMTSVGTVGNVLTGSWAYYRATIPVNTASVATNGLSVQFWTPAITASTTILIAGVQLEKGRVATPFEFRPYSEELMLCQRYYYQIKPTAPYGLFASGISSSTTGAEIMISYPVTLRSNTVTLTTSTISNFQWWPIGISTVALTGLTLATAGDGQGFVHSRVGITWSGAVGAVNQPGWLRTGLGTTNTEFLGFSCEL